MIVYTRHRKISLVTTQMHAYIRQSNESLSKEEEEEETTSEREPFALTEWCAC